MFRSPYDAGIEQLFDGAHAGPELMAGTPDVPEALLTDKGMDLLRNPSGEFASALRTADGVCTGWDPYVPLRLYVMPATTRVCGGQHRPLCGSVPGERGATPDR